MFLCKAFILSVKSYNVALSSISWVLWTHTYTQKFFWYHFQKGNSSCTSFETKIVFSCIQNLIISCYKRITHVDHRKEFLFIGKNFKSKRMRLARVLSMFLYKHIILSLDILISDVPYCLLPILCRGIFPCNMSPGGCPMLSISTRHGFNPTWHVFHFAQASI